MHTVLIPEWIVDGRNSRPQTGQAVIVSEGVIECIAPRGDVEIGAQDHAIELPGATLTPGLINNHVHLILPGNDSENAAYLSASSFSDAQLVARAVQNIAIALQSGVTTVRDCGGRHKAVLEVRNTQESGKITGARIISCGWPVTASGGHLRAWGGEADGRECLVAMVRRVVGAGADFIKLIASGGGTPGTELGAASFTAQDMAIVVKEAHSLGVMVSAHCIAVVSIENAVQAGVDLIEHASFVARDGTTQFDLRIAESLAASGIPVTPTLQVSSDMLRATKDETERLQRLEQIERRREMYRTLHDMGVQLLAGSDAGWRVTGFGSFWREIEELARCGLSPVAAIHSASGAVARALGVSERYGTIAPGRIADLLAVRGDVSHDLRCLSDVLLVMQGGKIVSETPCSRVDDERA